MVTNIKLVDLKSKSHEEPADVMASYKEDTGNYILCEMEFKRRQNRANEKRGWISLGVSVLALFISVAALAIRMPA